MVQLPDSIDVRDLCEQKDQIFGELVSSFGVIAVGLCVALFVTVVLNALLYYCNIVSFFVAVGIFFAMAAIVLIVVHIISGIIRRRHLARVRAITESSYAKMLMACLELICIYNSKLEELKALKIFIKELVPEKDKLLREVHSQIMFLYGHVKALNLDSCPYAVRDKHEEIRGVLDRMKRGFE